MPDYTFTREYGDTIHSNPDTYNIGHEGEPIGLSSRIQTALPGVKFIIKCNATSCIISTTEELTTGQQTTLSDTIDTHKAVEDWPILENANPDVMEIVDNTESTSTSSSPTSKVNLSIDLLNQSEYYVDFYYELSGNKKKRKINGQVTLNGDPITGVFSKKVAETTDTEVISGTLKVTLNSGTNNIAIKYWGTGSGSTTIHMASLIVRGN